MGVLKAVDVPSVLKEGRILDVDVARMRRSYYDDGVINATEADQLLTLNRTCGAESDAWGQLFVEALTDYLVNQVEPEGYVTANNVAWLITRVAPKGAIETKSELDLVINVLDRSRWSPESLSRLALEQVRRAVVDGQGPLRAGSAIGPGVVTDAEVDLIRRILYAFGGDGNIAVTRAEAEVLFDIEDAVADNHPTPAWTDLFSKAVANVILGASGYAPPSREEALRAEAWLTRRGDLAPEAFLTAAVTTSLSTIWDCYRSQSPEERALARLERQRIEIITNEEISDTEAQWIVGRLTRDGKLTPTETALVDFLKSEAPVLHPEIEALVAAEGRAA
ncbi:MAG: hypothetical protein NW216_00815 [Hyphomicrobium sp.]|nr:hypothetical protein [Hyphomicrobium sp.]